VLNCWWKTLTGKFDDVPGAARGIIAAVAEEANTRVASTVTVGIAASALVGRSI
jgi:hypothetical protein